MRTHLREKYLTNTLGVDLSHFTVKLIYTNTNLDINLYASSSYANIK